MEEKIIELRKQGKTYREIKKIVGCSLGTISYYCGEGQKNKSKKRNQNNKIGHSLANKVNKFCVKKRKIFDKVNLFKKKGKRGKKSRNSNNCANHFTIKDLLCKFGETTSCYLTGKKVNLLEPDTYHIDHIIPPCRGGNNEISNAGISCPEANIAKSGMLVDEFIDLCKQVLIYNGYTVTK